LNLVAHFFVLYHTPMTSTITTTPAAVSFQLALIHSMMPDGEDESASSPPPPLLAVAKHGVLQFIRQPVHPR
jgi:hypothetical protein